ncbi:MAG: C39 family peptidase [Deltaproteobacteria bacterium]|nr:C39 family peptidase [Deltaproteobacteria bacterium]
MKNNKGYYIPLIVVIAVISLMTEVSYSAARLLSLGRWESIRAPVKSWIEIKNHNLVRQEYDYSCGSAAVGTILKFFFNDNVNEQEVLDFILKKKGIDKLDKGKLEEKDMTLSFYDLKEFAEERNYKVLGLALDTETLKKLKIPAIVFVNIRRKEHFTVYKGMDGRFVYLADPSFGNIKVTHGRFQEMFYSRKNERYPGKMLVFITLDEKRKAEMNRDFMNIPRASDFVYRVIRDTYR